ncbi:hypothetical protein [Streptomyces sp. NPDC017940]|uniref:hypothetical protein n=1 Tax=Streptomyces sp. NPDC017940 TaxID=3365017 RepID=UPI003795A538
MKHGAGSVRPGRLTEGVTAGTSLGVHGTPGAPWLTGIRETWKALRANSDYCAVVSLSPSFFVERLLEWGAHATHGSLSDLALFAAMPVSVAVNADARLVDLATHTYVGRDLWKAYELVRIPAIKALDEGRALNSE